VSDAFVLPNLILALRGAVAVLVLTTIVGGLPRVVQIGLAALVGFWAAVVSGAASGAAGHADLFGANTGGIGGNGALVLLALREAIIGATLGLIAAVPLLAAATAGRLVNTAASARNGPYSSLFGVLAAAVFVGIDGHVAVMRGIAQSFASVPALTTVQPRVLDALGGLLPAAITLAIPWLITAAVVELAVGTGVRLSNRAALNGPTAAAVPAALVMMTATLVSTTAVAIAALVRATLF
jgi:flagellar biosynthesis protein FliR